MSAMRCAATVRPGEVAGRTRPVAGCSPMATLDKLNGTRPCNGGSRRLASTLSRSSMRPTRRHALEQFFSETNVLLNRLTQ